VSAIAIVGLGCRFAGAPDPSSYWQLAREGRSAFSVVPRDRFDIDAYYDENKRAVDKAYCRVGAFVDDVRSFPALWLGIPPRRVEVMDPQHRLTLEVAMEAIWDSGRNPGDLPRRTGVFMGATSFEYRSIFASRVAAQEIASGSYGSVSDPEAILRSVERIVPSRPYTAPGLLGNMIAATVAQELDLHGPAYTTDAACASALIAVADAVAQLRAGTIDAAVAGGVYLCLNAENFIAFGRVGAMSTAGVCRPFDHRADGFILGEGCGVVVLKRLEDAERDGDRIYAVLRGVATNNDGRGDGPMAPQDGGQSDAIRDAWADAGLDPALLGFVETHGTATDLGDPTEVSGLRKAIGDAMVRVALGSAKGNIGHTNSAAGIAGLIRAVLAVHHAEIPPMAGFEAPRPALGLDEGALYVPTRATRWSGRRLAGVSSFGFGGTNAHVILEGYEAASAAAASPELVLFSADDIEGLRRLAGRMAASIEADTTCTLSGVARACAVRPRFAHRAGVVATDRVDLVRKLQAIAAGDDAAGVRVGHVVSAPKIAFLYPGQGAQRVGMLGPIARRFPAVAASLASLEGALGELLPVPLRQLMWPETRPNPVDAEVARVELTATEACQPAMLAAGLALTEVLTQVGVTPVVVAGHSLGEFTAAAAAGVLDADEAIRYVTQRGLAMAALDGDHGAMAAVMAERERVAPLLVPGAVMANFNHPRQTVVSGVSDAVAAVVERSKSAGIKAVSLEVSHAFHSPVLDRLDVGALVAALPLRAPQIPVASAIADHNYVDAEDARAVFARHATSPVDFVGAVSRCLAAGADLFLQVGAGGPLASFARGCVPAGTRVLTLAGLDDAEGPSSLLDTLAQLWVAGVDVDAAAIAGASPVASIAPPVLPREVYWGIKDDPQPLPKLKGRAAAPTTGAAKVSAAPSAPPVASADATDAVDPVLDRVLSVIAKVSAYPKDALRAEMTLQEDLGFDSLMVGDLATNLADAFPGLGGIPQELLLNRPKVGDIVQFARTGRGDAATAANDDAALDAFTPTWVKRPLPSLPSRDLWDLRVAIIAGAHDEALAAAFGGVALPVGHALWAEAYDAVIGADVDAGDLLRVLADQDRAGAQPDVIVAQSGDGNAEVRGVVRAMGREWPDAVCKVVRGTLDAAVLRQEWTSADRSVDVRWDGGARFVQGLAAAPSAAVLWTPGPGETVLITGGTRGIGAKLGAALHARGCRVLLVGRGTPDATAAAVLLAGNAVHLLVDVTDRDALRHACAGECITAVVHAAGSLADGAIGKVDVSAGELARRVKIDGFEAAIAAAGDTLQVALAVGSWAGRFGSRHQAWYAAGNAGLEDVACAARLVVAEFGPWTSSEMVKTIPAPVQQAMRAEGVDFVSDDAGLAALLSDLERGVGVVVHGRDLPPVLAKVSYATELSVASHPYLADHAIDGVPILPLASATDLLAGAAGFAPPFTVRDLRLYQGVRVDKPVQISVQLQHDRAELRVGDRQALAYRARVRPGADEVDPGARFGGEAPVTSVTAFYQGVTFHGPMFQGIVAVDGVGGDFLRGTVRTGDPSRWFTTPVRARFDVDPLAFDSGMQLTAIVAWDRYRRKGTPVGFTKFSQLRPWPAREVSVDAVFGAIDGDRFSATLYFRDAAGLVAVAHDVAAELRAVEGEAQVTFDPKWTDPGQWTEVTDLEARLQMAEMAGIRIPYFNVHEGTAKNTSIIAGREMVNFSSYNYLGLSGDPRVISESHDAMLRYGTSVSASRVASGERPFHQELELLLARSQGQEDAVLFTAGHATNVTTIGHLFGAKDLVIHDELIHDSSLQGIKLSGAQRRGFRHEDPAHLEEQLKALRSRFEKVLIVVEGVYSMDGDIAQLPAYIELKRKYGCLLLVDEAHSYGVCGATGQGLREHFGIRGDEVDMWMGTLSKSLSSCGGWISGSKRLIRYLKYTAPGFVYSAGLTPQNGQAALSSLKYMLAEPWRVQKLQANAKRFHDALVARGVNTGPALGGSGVVPAVTGNSFHALVLSQRLAEQGINVQPIVYPAVADDAARLRFFLSSTHTDEQLDWTAEAVATTLAGVRKDFPG
jgi:8-amino-7-oxononanoate synthase